jgi:hypothetical protein
VDRWRDRLPAAKVMVDIHADEAGVVAAIDTRALGEAVVQLGGGRLKQDDRLDLAVGLSDIARIGRERVDAPRRFCASMRPAKRPRAPWRGPARGLSPVGARRCRADPDPRKDRLMPRAFLVVMDSVGCGGAPDADRSSTATCRTPAPTRWAISRRPARRARRRRGAAGPLHMPNLDALGLGAAVRLASGARAEGLDADPTGLWGAAKR